MASPEVGSRAPEVELAGLVLVDGQAVTSTYRLSDVDGPVVLVFYPGDATPVCTKQLCSYNSGLEEFTALGATVWGISTQDLASHESFAKRFDLTMPLLADPDKKAVRAYGLGRLGGLVTARSVFVVDAGGVVRYRDVRSIGLTFQDRAGLVAAVSALV